VYLEELRKQIDHIDSQIVKALNKRAEVILKIRELKKKLGRGIYSPEREQQVLERLGKINRGPIPSEALESIYREIMSSALALEKPLKIAYLGPQATFTHLAAIKKFGQQLEYAPCDSISAVFREVEKQNCDYGVVPIENSIEGAVTHTLDMLIDSDLRICAQIVMNISHNLLANCTKKDIKRIYSNPQVFAQCRLWLQKNFPKAELIDASSTTRAAQIARGEKNCACIASILAARVYGLGVLAKNIEDSPSNLTRFLVISASALGEPSGNDKTSIVFSIKDRVGALHDMLVPFKKYHINLTKIESRPSKKRVWDYYFFLDLEGHIWDKDVAKALKELEEKAKYLKILGSYPKAE
jgi:chorismate mutase/prephenate dehydratase